MASTPAATSVQLARAEKIRRTLLGAGWTSHRERREAHPGAVAASCHQHRGVKVLVLTLGGSSGQIVEITAEAVNGTRGNGAHQVRNATPSWRFTAYDAPVDAVLTAAIAAPDRKPQPTSLIDYGWGVEYAPALGGDSTASPPPGDDPDPSSQVSLRGTRFTRLDGVVTATFCFPTYTPPCESCRHGRDLGDLGGWIITGPGFAAEASAHTPFAVVSAFAHALPGGPRKPVHAAGRMQRLGLPLTSDIVLQRGRGPRTLGKAS